MTVIKNLAAGYCSDKDISRTEAGAKLRLHFCDSVAALIAGSASREGREIARSHGGSSALAIAVAQARLTETDDIHMASCATIGSVMAPAVLLIGHESEAGARQCMRALCAGYDAMAGLGRAVDGARILYRGLWPTYLLAPFGVAAAASVLMGLDEERTANALGLALGQISGAPGRPASGRNPRWLLAGWAAQAGLQAALAARDGFGGDHTLLDGDWLAQTHGLAFDPAPLAALPGTGILEASIKPVCTAKQAAATLAAFQKLLAEGLAPDRIETITIFVPKAYQGMIAHRPPGRIGRIVSAAWQCALAALHPDRLLDIEREDFSGQPAFATMLEKVTVAADDRLAAHFPEKYPAIVDITLTDGERRSCTVLDAPGDPGQMLPETVLRDKFQTLLSNAGMAGEARAIWQLAGDSLVRDGALAELHSRLARANILPG